MEVLEVARVRAAVARAAVARVVRVAAARVAVARAVVGEVETERVAVARVEAAWVAEAKVVLVVGRVLPRCLYSLFPERLLKSLQIALIPLFRGTRARVHATRW